MQDTSFCLFTPPPKGKKIVWEITSQCNMLCKHCCANASSRVPRNGFIFSDKKLSSLEIVVKYLKENELIELYKQIDLLFYKLLSFKKYLLK